MNPALHCSGSGGGPDVVLLHGFATNLHVWDPLAVRLGSAARLHALDLPGHGASPDWAPGSGLDDVARAAAAQVPPGALWVGWSLGALVALAAALNGTRMRGLVLIAPTPRFVNGAGWQAGTPHAQWRAFCTAAAQRPELLVQRFFGLCAEPGAAGRLTARALRVAHEAGGAPRPAGLALALEVLGTADLRSRLVESLPPLLVLHGGQDRVVPPAAGRWLANQVSNGRYLPLPAAGHAPLLGEPVALLAEAIANWRTPAGQA